jgi:hypothetical protein
MMRVRMRTQQSTLVERVEKPFPWNYTKLYTKRDEHSWKVNVKDLACLRKGREQRVDKNRMIYLKSVIAGLLAAIATFVVGFISIPVYLAIAYRSSGMDSIGWDPVSTVRRPLIWLVLIGIFLAGFLGKLLLSRSN